MRAANPSSTGFLTIIAKNYLAHARVLMASIEEYHPDAPRLVVLTDEAEGCFEPERERFQVMRSAELGIPDSRWFHFRYNTLELTTGAKPFAIRKALETLGVGRLVYLDADIRLFAPLTPVLAALDEASIALTPHLLSPTQEGGLAVERQLLRTGAYNLGFVAVRDDETTRSFLSWWSERLAEQCLVDLPAGLFVDQKWIDLVPGMFDGVRILREPGLNAAWWNLPERGIAIEGDRYCVSGEPLYFFHFSGFNAERPEVLSEHAAVDRQAAEGPVKQLLGGYAKSLLREGYRESSKWQPAFDRFEDGSPVAPPVRKVLELEPALRKAIDDPFSEAGREKLFEFWNRRVESPGGKGFLTRLAYRTYRSEPQLQESMPDVFGVHRDQYAAWFVSEGATRYRLPPELTAPLSGTPADSGCAALSPLALAIYESRRDLQQAFPDPYENDALGLLTWFLTYGEKECDIDPANRRALRLEFERLVEKLGSPIQRWRRRAKLALLSRSAGRQS